MSRHVPALIQGQPAEPGYATVEIDIRGFLRLRFVIQPGEVSNWDWSYWSSLDYE